MNIIMLILAGIAVVTTVISIFTTMKILTVRRQVNQILLNHNEITHILEEENRLLQNRILTIPSGIIESIEKLIDNNNTDIDIEDIKAIIKNDNTYNK